MPVALDPIMPRFPSGLDATAYGGKVTLRLSIDAADLVNDVVVLEAQPANVFEESARSALNQVRFKPAERDGQPVACHMTMMIVYAGTALAAAAP